MLQLGWKGGYCVSFVVVTKHCFGVSTCWYGYITVTLRHKLRFFIISLLSTRTTRSTDGKKKARALACVQQLHLHFEHHRHYYRFDREGYLVTRALSRQRTHRLLSLALYKTENDYITLCEARYGETIPQNKTYFVHYHELGQPKNSHKGDFRFPQSIL